MTIKPLLLALAAGSSLHAGNLVQFTAGTPAKADDVNRNFAYLDTAKAGHVSVDLLASAIAAKADRSVIDSLSRALGLKVDSVWVAKTLAAKADSSTTRRVAALETSVATKIENTVLQVAIGTRVDTGTYGKFVRALPTGSGPDTTAKRRIDSLSGVVGNKVDKGTITAASLHAIADTLGVSKGSLTVKGTLISTGGVLSTSVVKSIGGAPGTSEACFRLKQTNPTIPDGAIWDWTADQSGNGNLILRAVNDAENQAVMNPPAMLVSRQGMSTTNIALGAHTSVAGAVDATEGFQTNSVTRINANGDGIFQSVGINSAPSATGSVVTVTPTGTLWNEGIEILPSSGNWNGIFFRKDASASIAGTWCAGRSPVGAFVVMTPDAGKSNLTSGMAIFGSNDVAFGISPDGTAAFGSNLTVNGTLKAKATSAWADYVFEPGYQAMPLKEVASYAAANRHLPEIPSADEVAKDGIDLARMNALLLKKVEELTLHAVEQERKMDALAAKVEALEAGRK